MAESAFFQIMPVNDETGNIWIARLSKDKAEITSSGNCHIL